jgi:hypothetical protein
MLNRRIFIATGTAAVLTPSLFLTGCDSTTVSEFVSLIGTDAAALATFFGAGSLATQITSLASQIAVDITNWQSGGAAADAIQAINDLIALVNTIPVATPYAPLIILILSALAGLLALLPSSATSPASAKAIGDRHVTAMPLGGFDKHHMTQAKNSFTSQWNSQLAATPLKH